MRRPVEHHGPMHRYGWLVGGGIGAVVLGLLVLVVLLADDDPSGGTVGAALFLVLLFGFVPGAAIGGGIQLATRRAVRRRWRPQPQGPAPSRAPNGWDRLYDGCAGRVQQFHAVAGQVGDGPVRHWLYQIEQQMNAELARARELVGLGTAVAPRYQHGAPTDPMLRRISDQLVTAESGFAAAVDRAVQIRLLMLNRPDMTEARAQLELLEQQLPHLHTP